MSYLPPPPSQRDQSGAGLMQLSFDSSMISSAAHLHGEQGRVGGRGGGGFLSANTGGGGSSDSSFLPPVNPWSPSESANAVNGTTKAWSGIPPSR